MEHLTEYRPDLIFLDIQLRGGTGFDLIHSIPPETKIIFITAFDQYAVRAFTINALDYILKPVTPERLAESIQRLSPENPPLPNDTESMTPEDNFMLMNAYHRRMGPLITKNHGFLVWTRKRWMKSC